MVYNKGWRPRCHKILLNKVCYKFNIKHIIEDKIVELVINNQKGKYTATLENKVIHNIMFLQYHLSETNNDTVSIT